jgi:3-oxoadipate enol-lactonase
MAGDIVAVLDAAGIRRAHVMRASLGGWRPRSLAVTRSERVDGLVLACTTPGWPFAYPCLLELQGSQPAGPARSARDLP